jgi:hypothetical protein
MHIIIDLLISTTSDRNGSSWYGSNQTFQRKINVYQMNYLLF